MDVKRTLSVLDYINITAEHVEKDSAIRVHCIRWQCPPEDGHHQSVCVTRAKKFYRKNLMHGPVSIKAIFFTEFDWPFARFYFSILESIFILFMKLWCPLFKLPNSIKLKLRKDVTQTTINSPAGAYNGANSTTDEQDIRVRKYGEVVYNTLSSVASVLEYPKGDKIPRITAIWSID